MVEPVAVIFAGGQGTRLWPLSRADAPKQFQPLAYDISLTTATIERLKQLLPSDRIFVSTSVEYVAAAAKACLGDVPAEQPDRRALAARVPATAFALARWRPRGTGSATSPLFTCPSDHLIDGRRDVPARRIAEMFDQVSKTPEALVLLGAVPTHPDPNLGYMRAHRDRRRLGLRRCSSRSRSRTERVAAELIAEGSVFWNTMCYAAARSKYALDVYRRRRPEVTAAVEEFTASRAPTRRVRRAGRRGSRAGAVLRGRHDQPAARDPRARLERHRHLGLGSSPTSTRPTSLRWGRAVERASPRDVVVASLDGRPVVVLGVKDLVIVTHEDAVYVLDKEKAGDIAALEQLRTMLGETRKDLL